MSDLVTLRHPKLPPEQVIRIKRSQVGLRLAAGWEEVAPESSAVEPESEQPAVEPEKPQRRRRTTSEDND